MDEGCRFEPPRLDPSALPRHRLVQLLARRFEHRVTTVSAALGYGTSTALALAVQANALDPLGIDRWLGASEDDTDPDHLLAGIAGAVAVDPAGPPEVVHRRITDAVWTRAPVEVCLIVDDAHLIGTGEAQVVLERMVDTLPANGHVLFAGRAASALPIARLRARGELFEINERDLAFDDDEVHELHRRHGQGGGARWSRHPATARTRIPAHTGPTDAPAVPSNRLDTIAHGVDLTGLAADDLAHLVRAASDADAVGDPARALRLHRRAAELYRSTTDGADASLRPAIVRSLCRIAELQLAVGEIDEAGRAARRAHDLDPAGERPLLALLASLAATGDENAARDLTVGVDARLHAAGTVPGAALARLLERFRPGVEPIPLRPSDRLA